MSRRARIDLTEEEIKNLVLDYYSTKHSVKEIAEHYKISVSKLKQLVKDNKDKYIQARKPIGRMGNNEDYFE